VLKALRDARTIADERHNSFTRASIAQKHTRPSHKLPHIVL
jgi:hypothetical protein